MRARLVLHVAAVRSARSRSYELGVAEVLIMYGKRVIVFAHIALTASLFVIVNFLSRPSFWPSSRAAELAFHAAEEAEA